MGLPDPFGRPAPVPAPASPKPMPRTPASNPAPHMANHACSTQTSAATKQLAPPRATKQPHGHNPQLVLCSIALGSHRPARATHFATMGKSPFSRSHLGASHLRTATSPSHPMAATSPHLSHIARICRQPHTGRVSIASTPARSRRPTAGRGTSASSMGAGTIYARRWLRPRHGPGNIASSLLWGNTSHLPQRHSPSSGANTPQPTPQHYSHARTQG